MLLNITINNRDILCQSILDRTINNGTLLYIGLIDRGILSMILSIFFFLI